METRFPHGLNSNAKIHFAQGSYLCFVNKKRRKSMSFFDECAGNLEQQNAYRMIANTNNSFFLTGKAGTGKSTFLKRVCEEVKKAFVVLAPT